MPCDILLNLFIPYSTFANGEVKEFREVNPENIPSSRDC